MYSCFIRGKKMSEERYYIVLVPARLFPSFNPPSDTELMPPPPPPPSPRPRPIRPRPYPLRRQDAGEGDSLKKFFNK